jgi:hypothetical protein
MARRPSFDRANWPVPPGMVLRVCTRSTCCLPALPDPAGQAVRRVPISNIIDQDIKHCSIVAHEPSSGSWNIWCAQLNLFHPSLEGRHLVAPLPRVPTARPG